MNNCNECGARWPEEAGESCPLCGTPVCAGDPAADPAGGAERGPAAAPGPAPTPGRLPRSLGTVSAFGGGTWRLVAGLVLIVGLVVYAGVRGGDCQGPTTATTGASTTTTLDPSGAGLFPVRVDGEAAYIDGSGAVVLRVAAEGVSLFSEGLAVAGRDGKCGYIDTAGAFVIPPRFDSANGFCEGLAQVWGATGHGFIDKSGRLVLDLADYADARDFSQGLAAVATLDGDQGRYGFMDKTGKILIPAQYYDAGDFSEGLAAVCEQGLYGYIDKTGAWAIPPRYELAGPFSEGLAAVRTGGERGVAWGYVDKAGTVVIQPRFANAGRFSSGLAPVQLEVGDPYGYIDTKGAFVIQPRFDEAGPFLHGGLAQVLVAKTDPAQGATVDTMGDGETQASGSSYSLLPAYINTTGTVIWQGAAGAPAE